jgi:hypothetical protein
MGWIGLRENLNRKPWCLASKKWGFRVSIFPSSNSMNLVVFSFFLKQNIGFHEPKTDFNKRQWGFQKQQWQYFEVITKS